MKARKSLGGITPADSAMRGGGCGKGQPVLVSPAPLAVHCPKCGTDVMVTGWTETQTKTSSFMRFNERGAVLVATTVRAADAASCMCCNAALPVTPVELQRLA